MKRLIFWFVLGMVAVSAYRAHSRCAEEREQRATAELIRSLSSQTSERLAAVPDGDVARPLHGHEALAFYQGQDVPRREEAEGLPVPIVPGTRIDRAEIKTPEPRRPARPTPEHQPTDTPPPRGTHLVKGQLSATEERALADARVQLKQKLAGWLAPDVPPSWTVPEPLVKRLIQAEEVKAIDKDYGTVYEATLKVRLTPDLRAEIVEAYQRELVAQRLRVLAAILGFILACLAALAGYIRADEATKGYYSNWLRVAAAAGVGAAGTLAYRLLT